MMTPGKTDQLEEELIDVVRNMGSKMWLTETRLAMLSTTDLFAQSLMVYAAAQLHIRAMKKGSELKQMEEEA